MNGVGIEFLLVILVKSSQEKLIQHRDSMKGTNFLLHVHIAVHSVFAKWIVPSPVVKCLARGEEINDGIRVFFIDFTDAVIDASSLGSQLGLIKSIKLGVIRVFAVFPLVGVIIGRGPKDIDIENSSLIHLLLE